MPIQKFLAEYMYADVVFPLPFRNSFTYIIPQELEVHVITGVRVVVPFGRRILTGFVINTKDSADETVKLKSIFDVLDARPIFNSDDLKFYTWISDYYLSSLGEALKNCVPYGSDVESKRVVVSDPGFCSDLYFAIKKKTSTKAKVLEVLSKKDRIKISYLQKVVGNKNIYSTLRSLENEGACSVINEVEDPKVKAKTALHVKLNKDVEEVYELIPEIENRSPKQVVILLELLNRENFEAMQSELLTKTGTNASSVESLRKKGILTVYEKEVERRYKELYKEDSKEIKLTEPQQIIVDGVNKNIIEEEFKPYLLYGVTGSGKTQVYIELAKTALNKNKTVLILVPEISLTPQITSRFFNAFGDKVTVLHSKMSLGERYDSWRGIIAGKYDVVIGPRSALFAPLKDIGLIVVDEEHDSSYKQYDIVPKYNARDAAVIRAWQSNSPIILGSATPSTETLYNSKSGKYNLHELKDRIDNAKMPVIKLIDIKSERKKRAMENVFSTQMVNAIKERVEKKEGVIVLQNRRGFATQVFCEDCGDVMMCPDCSVPLVHHIYKNTMQCHYCNNTFPVYKSCNHCGSLALKFFGTGTQRVEDELEFHLPEIRMERLDSDTMNKKGKLSSILNQFRKGELDVLVGTQIVAKGMDFSNVTLVCVISAETTLWMPDFRADERTMQLLTQVAGRAGRSEKEGEVLIQTQDPKHFVLQKVLIADYDGFYEKEIKLREQSDYPPFTRVCLIEFKDKLHEKSLGAAKDFYNHLVSMKAGLKIMPPQEAIIAKLKGQYRFQIFIKSFRKVDPSGSLLRKAVLESYIQYNQKSRFRDIRPIIDIDPQNIS